MRIKTRLLITGAVPLLMGLAIAGLVAVDQLKNRELDGYRTHFLEISTAVFELTLVEHEFMMGRATERVSDQWRLRYTSLEGLLQRTALMIGPQEEADFQRLRHTHATVGVLHDHIVALRQQGSPARPGNGGGEDRVELSVLLAGQQLTKLYEMTTYTNRILQSVLARHREQLAVVRQLTFLAIGGIMVLGALAAWFLNKHIVQAVHTLREGSRTIGSGNLEHRITIPSDDELGQLCATFNRMTQRLQETLISRDHLNQEVAERQRAQQELQELNKELDHLVVLRTLEVRAANRELQSASHAAAHNLRTPLRAVNGFCTALLEDHGEELSPAARENLELVLESSREMERTMEGFLRLVRATSSGLNPVTVDLSRLATDLLEGYRAAEPLREVSWEVENGMVGHGDPEQLRRVMEALLGNAWKFTRPIPRPHITCSSHMEAGERVYRVADNGVGFDMAHGEKLFQPFHRAHRFTEFPGIGVDLAIAQRIIQRHGGRIWARSAPGEGAVFQFTLSDKGALHDS